MTTTFARSGSELADVGRMARLQQSPSERPSLAARSYSGLVHAFLAQIIPTLLFICVASIRGDKVNGPRKRPTSRRLRLGLSADDPTKLPKERNGINVQGIRKLLERVHRWRIFFALNHSHIVAIEAGTIGEFLLS